MTEFQAAVTLKCPFCKGVVSADRGSEEGELPEREPGVVHTMPTCSKFDELEPDAFLLAVNTELRTKQGIGYT